MQINKYLYPFFLLLLAYLLFSNENLKFIIFGIAMFLLGMLSMEDGFKIFSGGIIEKVLQKTTNSVPKALGTGFIATAIVQSSSLISIIIISLLSAELISLSGAVGVLFGSNMGTTATAWIVSAFGVKIKIAQFALPMIVFGVVFRFHKKSSYKGIGTILIGLGFVFLGIGYMKEGFDTLNNAFTLSAYAIEGYLGVLVYVMIGTVITVVVQSSSATIAIVITALASGQIEYFNALQLTIGANIGTTITVIIASLGSNANGKRLAIADLIFKSVTALFAITFIFQLVFLIDVLAQYLGISIEDYAMKLALFHTIFNLIGIILLAPFSHKLVRFLETLFISNERVDGAKYLDDVVINIPVAAILAIQKEVEHLYSNAIESLSHALSLHRHEYLGYDDIASIVKNSTQKIGMDIDTFYSKHIKDIYGEIIHYATLAQEDMSVDEKNRVYELKVACKDIVEVLKEVKELQKNIDLYRISPNEAIKSEYNFLRLEIAKTISSIHGMKEVSDDFDLLSQTELLKQELDTLDVMKTGKIDTLIRSHAINTKMATSLINDSAFAYRISRNLIDIASILWIKDRELQKLRDA